MATKHVVWDGNLSKCICIGTVIKFNVCKAVSAPPPPPPPPLRLLSIRCTILDTKFAINVPCSINVHGLYTVGGGTEPGV